MTEDSGGLGIGALALLGDSTGSRWRRALTAWMVAQTVCRVGKRWWDRAQTDFSYRVSVGADDPVYADVHAWVLDHMPEGSRRALTARTSTRSNGPVSVDGVAAPAKVTLFYDGSRPSSIDIDGNRVKVEVVQPDMNAMLSSDADWSKMPRERIIFTGRSATARDAILAFVEAAAKRRETKPPQFRSGNRWGDWRSQGDTPARTLDSVILRAGQLEALVDDLTEFMASEAVYGRLGIPWHRGYLLHGPPGCGKTSVAKALATHLSLDVYYIHLGVIEDDSRLAELISSVGPRSVLVIEDIDIVHGARTRDGAQQAKGVTLAGLLNVLDGFLTPHGLISVMTTNDVAALDPALVRAGRVDRAEHIGELDDDQLRRLLDVIIDPTPGALFLPALLGPVTPAAVVEVVKRHLDDPVAAIGAIVEWLGSDRAVA